MITAPGIYRMPESEYHSDPCLTPSLSSTMAKTILAKTPLHAWMNNSRLNPDYIPMHSKAFDIGTAAHRQALGAGADWVIIPTDLLASNGAASTKEAKQFIADARERGLTPIKEEEAVSVYRVAKKVRERLGDIGVKLNPEHSETAAFAKIDGVWCRALVDNADSDTRAPLYDLKTTTDANPESIAKTIMSYGYDVQAQHYREVWKAATGEDRAFRFIFVEKEPPHEICIIELSGDDLLMAERRIRRAREIFAGCLANDDWPGYPSGIVQIKLPEYYQAKWLEREGGDWMESARAEQPPIYQLAGE